MKFVVVGLGNPGEEYANTRHNAGKMAVEAFIHAERFPELVASKKYASLISEGSLLKQQVLVMAPETFMNKSGSAVKKAVASKKAAKNLIVIYDDIDLPLGKLRISVGRGSGGHNGVASIIKSLGTKDFVRVRIGVAPTTPGGKIKKPKGEQKVLDYLMGDFKKKEQEMLKKQLKAAADAAKHIIEEGVESAMNEYN